MIGKGKNDYCAKCEEFNTVLDGVCCRCCTNVTDGTPATDEQVAAVARKLDAAAAELRRVLEKY